MSLMSIWENIMNLRRQMNIDSYLYEIVEDYIDETSTDKRNAIFESFCSSIWTCKNKRRIYTKTIRFNVRKDLLETDIGKIFDTWSTVEYKGHKSMSQDTDWSSLIRQKINNIYTRYFDKEVILNNEYINQLKTPKRLYYEWIRGKGIDVETLTSVIDEAISTSELLKLKYQRQKMDLSWGDYKEVINGFLFKIFNNAKKIEDYENKEKLINKYDFINEDNFYIKFFCKSLEGEIKKWQKTYYNLPQNTRKQYTRCQSCGKLIHKNGKNHKYCSECKRLKQLEWQRNSMRKSRSKSRSKLCEVL